MYEKGQREDKESSRLAIKCNEKERKMADTNMNVSEMVKWHANLSEELAEVDKVLDEVSKVCSECTDDDTVYGELKKLGESIGEAYVELVKKYRETMDFTGEIIERTKRGISNIGQYIQDFVDGFTR